MKKVPVTIKDLARELNVSVSTVSRALRGVPDINPETKKAVLDLAKKLDYHPNPIALSLVKSKTFTIGVVVPEFVNPFFPSVIIGIQDVAAAAGYNVLICQSNESWETEMKNIKALMASRVDGLLISVTHDTKDISYLKQLHERGLPMVQFNRICEDLEVPKVVVNDYQAAYEAVVHLIETGHKKIAHLAGPNNLAISKNRLAGYIQALKDHHIPINEKYILHGEFTAETSKSRTIELLSLSDIPDAIFAVNDPVAIGAIQYLKSEGIKIPEEMAIVGFTETPIAGLIEPSLTTVAQPTFEIGQRAARLLLDQIDSKIEIAAETIVLNATLVIRNSSGKRHDSVNHNFRPRN